MKNKSEKLANPPRPFGAPLPRRGIGKHIFKVGGWTAVSRVFGFIRDMLIANVLGAGRLSDIFIAASKLPNLFRDLLGEGAFSSVFVPMFCETRDSNCEAPDAATQFAKNAYSWLMAILLGITILALIFMPLIIWILAPGFSDDPSKMQLTVLISRITIFYLIFICGSAFLSSVLNAFSEFSLVASMSVLMNVFMIGGLLLARHHSQKALYIMSFALVLSGIVQMWILAGRLRQRKFGLRLIRPRWTPKIKTMFRRFGVTILSSGFYQINIILGALVASFQSGAISWLYYSDRIVQLPFAIIGLSAGTVLLTSISEALAKKNLRGVYIQQNSALRSSLMLTLPAVAGLFVLAEPIIKILFQHGAWEPASTKAVAIAIMIMSFALPAMTTSQIYSKTLYAAQDVRTPVKVSVIALITSSLIYIAAFPFIGYLAVPIGTVIAGYLRNFLFWRACHRRKLFKMEPKTIRATIGFGVLSAALGAGLWFVPVHNVFVLAAALAAFGIIYLPIAFLINKKI